jgi:hypothetical protein
MESKCYVEQIDEITKKKMKLLIKEQEALNTTNLKRLQKVTKTAYSIKDSIDNGTLCREKDVQILKKYFKKWNLYEENFIHEKEKFTLVLIDDEFFTC